jgi:NSS family neurotransmitter:Na+ symporter
MLEAVVAYAMERFNMSRKKSAIITTILIGIVGIFAALSNGPLSHILIFENTFLNFLDKLTANYFMTIGSLITILFVGWKLDKNIIENQITNEGILKSGYQGTYYFITRYISPLAIIIVFLASIGII